MAYDSAVVSFTTKTDKVDLVQAAHMNAVQAELVTIETILGTGLKGTSADLSTRLNKALDSDGSILSGTSFPSPALASQIFFRTDLSTLYIFYGGWNSIGVPAYSAGDILLTGSQADAEESTNVNADTKLKEFCIPRSGTLRIKFDMKVDGDNGRGRIYRNGVAVGSEQTTSSTSYATYSQDISGWATGDLLQLYGRNDSGGANYTFLRNFRLYADIPSTEVATNA